MIRHSLASPGTAGTLLFVCALLAAAPAHAQDAPPTRAAQLPRSLQGGAPASRLLVKPAKSAAAPAPRPSPAPSIKLDAPPLPGREQSARRSEALLQREIALLKRLIGNSPSMDTRRADALLRLAHAYQDLIWLHKQRAQRLLVARAQSCGCRAANVNATAVACVGAVRDEVLASAPRPIR